MGRGFFFIPVFSETRVKKGAALSLIVLVLIACSGCMVGPSMLSRHLDDWVNAQYVQAPWLYGNVATELKGIGGLEGWRLMPVDHLEVLHGVLDINQASGAVFDVNGSCRDEFLGLPVPEVQRGV